jgi:phage repressor protein C with HTH and peptisase S24 domain
MITHHQVWHGIERLAETNGLSASGLARRAGLDPTTFNKSKRITRQGKQRWPSTESLAKILEATGSSMEAFVALMKDGEAAGVRASGHRLPSIAFEELGAAEAFDASGFPVGPAWEQLDFPGVDDPHAYAVELRSDALAPGYREGDVLIVAPSASVRRRDRILLRLDGGAVLGGTLQRRNAQRVVLRPFFAPAEERPVEVAKVAWMARIVWASQ